MKKLVFTAILLLSLPGVTVYAADALKIQQDGVVKRAKEIGSGNGIVFTLPDLNNTDFVIDSYELAIFEKKQTDTIYKVFGNTKLVENPASLNVTFDFGSTTKYQLGARYKIGYRYYVRSLDDVSILEIAGLNTKEGWRLVGEANPTASSTSGFSFYLNSAPAISVNTVSWDGEDVNGARTFTYTAAQLAGAYLHKSALSNGITVGCSVSDPDSEDTLTVYYKLINKANGAVIVDSVLGNDRKISNATAAENIDLVLYAIDNWGGRTEAAPVTLKIDRQAPAVTSQFQDMGRAIRGGELYSKFVLTDDSGMALSNGNVYYSVKRNGTSVANTTKLGNNVAGEYIVNMLNQTDGAYEITLTMFDKSYNKLVHILTLTLDNTPPTLRFIPQSEDERSTLYNLWVNYIKNIVIDVADSSGIKKIDCTESGGSVYRASGTGFKFIAVPNKTGKLNFSISLEDNACTLDKMNNSVNTASQGNISTFSNSVWIDKTPPAVTINAEETTWYAPFTVTASFNDNDSGIKAKQYQIGDAITENWLAYTDGIELGAGGIYYLHVKATDNAGNETVVSKKIKVNSPLVIGNVRPTSDYLHTIYNSLGDIYIIKNTAFNTKFTFDAQDNDITDTLKANVRLINEDNNSIYSTVAVYVSPDGNINRSVVFNMSYLKSDGSVLPDGVYSMELSVSQIKSDGDVLTLNSNIKACEVVIKRTSPPKPQVKYENGKLTVDYPEEVLSHSLNRAYIKAMYKREYKIVKDGQADSNVYKPYTEAVTGINYDCNVTALYTDPAGNISTRSMRVFGSIDDEDENGCKSIKRDGNSVRLEEGRQANIYYIGIRRDKNVGIDNDVFKFLN